MRERDFRFVTLLFPLTYSLLLENNRMAQEECSTSSQTTGEGKCVWMYVYVWVSVEVCVGIWNGEGRQWREARERKKVVGNKVKSCWLNRIVPILFWLLCAPIILLPLFYLAHWKKIFKFYSDFASRGVWMRASCLSPHFLSLSLPLLLPASFNCMLKELFLALLTCTSIVMYCMLW